MFLKKLHLLNFKNYHEVDLSFSDNINCFLGNNGVGKTNLLDAIFYLAFCKSYFNPSDSQIVKHDEGFMVLQGEFYKDSEKNDIYCGLKIGQKKQFKKNKKEYEKLAEHIGFVPLVMISPADSDLILDGSEVRRRFLDLIISQYDKTYLTQLIQYNKAVSQRNRLLKKFMETRSFDEESLSIWDEQLIQFGEPIHAARSTFIEKFTPLFQSHYEFISESKEIVSLEYLSQLQHGTFREELMQNRQADRRRTFTTVGIHKDDLQFNLSAKPLKKFGSQGQQKTYLLALKLAQSEFLSQVMDTKPILLLDDIYDKLDNERVAKLMKVVQSNIFGQVFISDTSTSRLPKLFNELGTDFKFFIVNNGEVKDGE